MKFITEEDLRDSYKIVPFTSYDIEPGTRLTPGARQFLLDRGMDLYEKDFVKNNDGIPYKKQADLINKKKTWKNKKITSRLKSMESMFLITIEGLLNKDACLAQRVIELYTYFSGINKIADGSASGEKIFWNQCTGMNIDNFSDDLDDCFEITEFHLQLEKGSEIIALHRLRCQLHEMEPFLNEFYDADDTGNAICKEMVGRINNIINCLSQMICSAFGGEKCQRQN
jgi:hypothetical protein